MIYHKCQALFQLRCLTAEFGMIATTWPVRCSMR